MNERIKELADLAYSYASEQTGEFSPEFMGFYDQQFAELIVRECAAMADFADQNPGDYVLKHFGVE